MPAVSADGWLRAARRVDSPNFDARPAGVAIDLVVIHSISLPPGRYGGDAVERLFTNTLDPAADPAFIELRDLRVSAHFLIARDGVLTQFVACTARAWHAGVSEFAGRSRCNDFSIGVELEGTDVDVFAPAQYVRLRRLLQALCAAYPLRAICGHDHIAPERKTDPGSGFDWPRLAAFGLPHLSLPPTTAAPLR